MPIVITNPPGGAGTLTGADNGTSLDGTGKIVELGGALIKTTNITGGAFNLGLHAGTAPQSSNVLCFPSLMNINHANTGENASIQIAPIAALRTSIVLRATYTSLPAGNQSIIIGDNTTSSGISVDDTVSGIGLVKTASILKANQLGNPNAYVTTDCLGSSFAGSINQRLQVALSTTFTLYAVPAGANQLFAVNIGFFLNSLGGTSNIQISLIYTDEAGTVRTILMASVNSLVPPVLSPVTVYAQQSTNIQISVVLNLAGASYNLYATAQYLGIQN